ncbi:MAG: ImmA/IrrE family metallo-endopeptidase [Candidatus Babeliaceae bacterium]|jgi:Zn-dependent peptidase ImmA (M78 family)
MVISYNYSRKILLGVLVGLTGLALGAHWYTHQKKSAYYHATPHTIESCTASVHTFLQQLDHPAWQEVSVQLTDDVSYATDKDIFINTNHRILGPLEFVVAHESGHVAADHYNKRNDDSNELSIEQLREQEKEADLLACTVLYNLDKIETIYQRIANLQFGVDNNWETSEKAALDDHPSLQENVEYMKEFLKNKGLSDQIIEDNIQKYMPYFNMIFNKSYITLVEKSGTASASEEATMLAQEFLDTLDVPLRWLIRVKASENTCATAWHIWINEDQHQGCKSFALAHECSHIALKHWTIKNEKPLSLEELRVQEKEADLLACSLLHNLNKTDGIYERLAYLQVCHSRGFETPEKAAASEHPSVPDTIMYIQEFLKSKGIAENAIDSSMQPYVEHYNKLFGK